MLIVKWYVCKTLLENYIKRILLNLERKLDVLTFTLRFYLNITLYVWHLIDRL